MGRDARYRKRAVRILSQIIKQNALLYYNALGERQGRENSGLTDKAPESQDHADPQLLATPIMNLTVNELNNSGKKTLFYITTREDLRYIEDFIVDMGTVDEHTDSPVRGPFELEFIQADKEAGKDKFYWNCEGIDGLDDLVQTLHAKLNSNVYYFTDDRRDMPPIGNIVECAYVLTIAQDPSTLDLSTNSRFCFGIKDVEQYIEQQPIDDDESIYEIHLIVASAKPQGEEEMIHHIVNSFKELKNYTARLPWFAQVPSDDNPDGTGWE